MNNDYNRSSGNESKTTPQPQNFGFPSDPTPPINPNVNQSPNGTAIASMVLGIVALTLCCCYGVFWILTGVLGIAAIVCAVVSRAQAQKFHGMAIAGLTLGIVAVVLFLFFIFVVMLAIGLSADELDIILSEFL